MLERLIQGEGEFIFTWQSVRHHRFTYRPGEQWIHTFSSSFIMLTMILNSRWHHTRDASLPIGISQCTPSTSSESSWSSIPNGRRFDTARSSQPSLLTIMQSLAFYMLPFTSVAMSPHPGSQQVQLPWALASGLLLPGQPWRYGLYSETSVTPPCILSSLLSRAGKHTNQPTPNQSINYTV